MSNGPRGSRCGCQSGWPVSSSSRGLPLPWAAAAASPGPSPISTSPLSVVEALARCVVVVGCHVAGWTAPTSGGVACCPDSGELHCERASISRSTMLTVKAVLPSRISGGSGGSASRCEIGETRPFVGQTRPPRAAPNGPRNVGVCLRAPKAVHRRPTRWEIALRQSRYVGGRGGGGCLL